MPHAGFLVDNCFVFMQIDELIFRTNIANKGGNFRMDKKFLNRMNKALSLEKEDILENLMSENEDFEALIKDLDPKDLADIAADDIDRKTLEVLSSHDIKRLRLIDSAISRIKNDRYGVCMRCNKLIPRERLEAIPYAIMCINCQSTDERRNR